MICSWLCKKKYCTLISPLPAGTNSDCTLTLGLKNIGSKKKKDVMFFVCEEHPILQTESHLFSQAGQYFILICHI